jgi:pilus assembly protein CpaC
MNMNLTYLRLSACKMSALVALAGALPVAVTAAPVLVDAKAATTAPVAAKATGSAPVVAKAAHAAPVAAKAPVSAPVVAKAATTAPVAAKATGSAPVVAKAASAAPVAAKAPGSAPVVTKAATVAPVAANAPGTAPVAAKAARIRGTSKSARVRMTPKNAPVPLAVTGTPSVYLVPVGESRVYRLDRPIKRVAVGNPEVADYIMLNSTELYLLGKKEGATNLIVWDQNGNFTTTPLEVSRGTNALKVLLKVVLPNENDIQLFAWGPALVLSGSVSNALAAETAYRLVKAYLGGTVPGVNPESTLVNTPATPAITPGILGVTSNSSNSGASGGTPNAAAGSPTSAPIPGVVNLLKIRDPQQVRLEVRIAEVSRSLIESMGLGWSQTGGYTQGSLMTGFVSNATIDLILNPVWDANVGQYAYKNLKVDALRQPGLVKILAEPTIVTMSGQEGYFLVGGKVYTPTVAANGAIDYVERTYGVGLRFTPTVLDAGRISLKVAPEVSEPDTKPITAGTSNALPSFKISTVSTIVQMNEGENLVIGGLLRDKLTENIQALPLLGQIPILGALFRHTSKDSETTELMVVVRPTLVKASTSVPELPTDRFIKPSDKELFIDGKLQGSRAK